jgi:hypothetical protein
MLIFKCQRNNRRNQTALHPQRKCRFAVVADIVVVVAVVAARALTKQKIWPK